MKKSKFLILILLLTLLRGDDGSVEVLENINETEIQETTTTSVIVEETRSNNFNNCI